MRNSFLIVKECSLERVLEIDEKIRGENLLEMGMAMVLARFLTASYFNKRPNGNKF
jgi:hypothetical protein